MKFWFTFAIAIGLVFGVGAAEARFPRGTPSGGAGRSVLNIGAVDYPGAFMNFMKVYQSQSFSTASPADLDADGYPKTTLAANVGGSILLPSGFAGDAVSWVLENTGTRVVRFVINAPVTKSAQTGAGTTVTGGSNSAMTVTFSGAGTVTFNFNSYSASELSLYFPSGFANATGTGEISLVRSSDRTAYLAGGIFTPEFVSSNGNSGIIGALNPKIVRTMGWAAVNGGNEVKWNYRKTTTSLSYLTEQYPPNVWGGTVSGTNTYTLASLPTDSTSSWINGEIIQCKFTNENTSTSATLTVTGKTGTKSIATSTGETLSVFVLNVSAATIQAGALSTLVYDSVLDKLLYFPGGGTASIPIEVQVALANQLRAYLWTNIPAMADDTYVSTWAAYIRDNLNSTLSAYLEYGNEIWNFSGAHYVGTQWAFQRGLALGWPSANNEPSHGWYGLRFRQIMGAITSLWGGRGGLKRVLAFQAYGDTTQINKYRFQGFDLNSTNFPTYGTFTGSVNYDTSPNRPIDYADVLSYSTYYQGAYFNDSFAYNGPNSTLPAAGITAMTSMATNYRTGAVSTAKAALDADFRTGTNSNVSNPQTLADLNTTIYPAWETLVNTSYSSKTIEAYEGGLQAVAPTAAQCTALGITDGVSAASAATNLAALLEAYKNDTTYGKNIVIDQFTQFMAFSHSRTPAWLITVGPNAWSLLPGELISSQYQNYYGFQQFNN